MQRVRKNTIYRHYKGGLYLLKTTSTHTETCEGMIVYTDGVNVWDRPREMFLEDVPFGDYMIPRFEEVKGFRSVLKARLIIGLKSIKSRFCLHSYEPSEVSYHMECKKCKKLDYVGP